MFEMRCPSLETFHKDEWRVYKGVFYYLGKLDTTCKVRAQHESDKDDKTVIACLWSLSVKCEEIPASAFMLCLLEGIFCTVTYAFLFEFTALFIQRHLTENSMIHSFDRSAIMLSRQPLNIYFTVFNGLHVAEKNVSLVWSTLHFHPKQIHSVNWASKRLHTKPRAHRNWKETKHEGVRGGSFSMSYTCLFVFKRDVRA